MKPRLCAIALLCVVDVFGAAAIRRDAADAPPNIVFIFADDLGYADLSAYGRKEYRTPSLDRLAAEGVRFSQAYAAAPVCTPSRTAFITGRYPARTAVGLREPLTGHADRPVGLAAGPGTVASLLKARGYATALVGKWHLGAQPEHHPNRHGFDEFFGTIAGAADYISHVNPLGESDLFRNEAPIKREGYLTDLLTEEAVTFIARGGSQPFFLSVHYTAPHWPWQAPGDQPHSGSSAARPAAAGVSRPPDAVAAWIAGGSSETYAAMMKRLDDGVGAILAAIDKSGRSDNTLVIFTSDNGGERFSDMGPFSGKKMQLWEGGIRVPAMMRWPRVLPAARETAQVAITMDWTATILAAARAQAGSDDPPDGLDLMPVCRGDAPIQSRTLAWRTFQRAQQKALRHGDWKYLQDEKGDYLFDLTDDPAEKRNLKDTHPERFNELKKLHQAWEAQMLEPVSVDLSER